MKYYFSFFILLLLSYQCFALDLGSFIDTTLKIHPKNEIYPIQLDLKDQNIIKSQSFTDWSLSQTTSVAHAKPAQSSSFTPNKTETNTVSTQIGKSIWNTGGTVSFFNSLSQLNQDSRSLISNGQSIKLGNNNFFENQFGISATYPLINNKNGELSKYNYSLTKLSKKSLEAQLLQDKERFVLGKIDIYLNWVLISKLEQLTLKRYKVAKKSLNLLEKKFKANLIDKVDILKQEDYIQNIKQELLKIEATKQSIKKEISLNTNLPLSDIIAPKFKLSEPLEIYTNTSFSETLDNTIFSTTHTSYELEELYYENSKKPKLDIDVSYALVGADSDFTDSFSLDKYSAYIGITYSRTLHNRSNQADIESTKLKMKELNALYETDKLRFNVEKEKLLVELNSFKNIVTVNKNQIKLALQTAKEEQKLYDIGKGNLSFVLQAQENVHQSEIRLLRTLLEVHTLTFKYLALTDQILSYFDQENLN